ncbi:hypothetical protein CGRA01v4_06730 [Colletotrichum graminicola]|nr:hypothetical protein CGRA01v4_06730 [Colletotrichum graminicola]
MHFWMLIFFYFPQYFSSRLISYVLHGRREWESITSRACISSLGGVVKGTIFRYFFYSSFCLSFSFAVSITVLHKMLSIGIAEALAIPIYVSNGCL